MDGHDRAGPVRDGRFDLRLVDIHGVRADIHKDGRRSGQDDCRGSAGEGEAGNDDLVALFQTAQDGRHFQRSGSAGRQQDLLRSETLFQVCVALFGELTVAADLVCVDGLLYIIKFCPDEGRDIERNHICTSIISAQKQL